MHAGFLHLWNRAVTMVAAYLCCAPCVGAAQNALTLNAVSRWMHMEGRMIGRQGTSPGPSARACLVGMPPTAPRS